MKNTPIERHLIDETINEFQIVDFSKATIREVKAIASKAEAASGVEFIKMEMGVPGLPPSAVMVSCELIGLLPFAIAKFCKISVRFLGKIEPNFTSK